MCVQNTNTNQRAVHAFEGGLHGQPVTFTNWLTYEILRRH